MQMTTPLSPEIPVPALINTQKDGQPSTKISNDGIKRYDRLFLLNQRHHPTSDSKKKRLECFHKLLRHGLFVKNRKEQASCLTQTVNKILNGLTRCNIYQRQEEIEALTIDTEEDLLEVFKLIYEKAVIAYDMDLSLLARVCFALSEKTVPFPSASDPAKTKHFRSLLLAQVKTDFDQKRFSMVDGVGKKNEIQNAKMEKKKIDLKTELEEYLSLKRNSERSIRFIGELFNARILFPKLLNHYIYRLLNEAEYEESIEYLCILLTTVGKEIEYRVEMELSIEGNSNLECLNEAFKVLESIVKKNEISSHIRSRIEQVIDLRNRSWDEADQQRNQNFQTEEDSREGRLCSLRGQTSNEELQSAINNDTSAIQDSQNNEEDQTFSRSTRDANDFLEGDDCVDKDELAITLTVTNILNGLTWYNIEQRQEEIGALTIDTEKRLLIVLNLIYKQAVNADPAKSPLFARICFVLMKRRAPSAKNPSKEKLFRKLLLAQCLIDFDNKRLPDVVFVEKKKEIQNAKTEKIQKELETELEEYFISRKTSRTNIRFIGELFKVEMFPPNILSRCIRRLSSESKSEESLECLCILLTTVGEEIEYRKKFKVKKATSNVSNMNAAFDVLESVVTGSDMSNHIRSRIQEVIDLRKHNWIHKNRDHQAEKNSDKKVDGLGCSRGQTSNEELQSAIDTSDSKELIQDSQSNEYPIEDQTFSRLTREQQDFDKSLENGDCVKDKLAMSTVTKSVLFSPMKDDRFGQDSFPLQNPGFHDSLSSPQFHENLVTDPDLAMFQSPPETREMSKDALLGKSTVKKEDIEQKSLELLLTFFTNDQNVEGAVLEMKNWLHEKTIAEFIYQCLLIVYELDREERRATSSLIKEMVKRNLFNPSDVKEGYTKFLEMAEDWIVRFPNLLWESAVELVEPLFEEGAINLQFLSELSSILNSSLAADFVAAVLKELVSVQSVAGAEKLWIMSNASFASVLPAGADPKAFLTRHKELEFLSKLDSLPKVSGSVCASVSACQISTDLEQYLRNASELTDNEVYIWIQEQNFGEVNSAFIRALTTAVVESSIEKYDDSELNHIAFNRWASTLLRRYVNNVTDRELEVLFAVQNCLNKRHDLSSVVQTLLDNGVVSEESWELWFSMNIYFECE